MAAYYANRSLDLISFWMLLDYQKRSIRAEKTMTATDVTGFDGIFSTGFFATFSTFRGARLTKLHINTGEKAKNPVESLQWRWRPEIADESVPCRGRTCPESKRPTPGISMKLRELQGSFDGHFWHSQYFHCMGVAVLRKILLSVKFVSAILGPEMGASILWTPGKMRSFCQKNPCP